VTAIGGGDLDLAISAARGVPARDVERALHEAIERGVALFDVAADAESERLAGDSVRELRARDRAIVATRVAMLDERPGAPNRDALRERLPVGHVQQRVEASLRATRLEALPLAQLPLRPAWIASPAWPELVGACARLVREGKVLAWGALLDEPGDDAPALLDEPWLAAVSVVYNLCDRRAEPLFEPAAKRQLAVLARRPLAGGALAGALGPGALLPPRDDRRALDDATLERIAVAMAQLSVLVKREPPAARSCDAARAIAERASQRQPGQPGPARPEDVECTDVAELALRFAIDRAGIALPRLHRRDHLTAAIAAASAPPLSSLSVDLVAQLVRS
jgi:aryl-alcohol dehydrogenase-like predicted oxidoreductase